MALIDEVRFSLTRIETSTSPALETEFQHYIDEAILDLTSTTDIIAFDATTTDALLKGAIITYCHYCFELDTTRKTEYKKSYDDLKTKLSMSSKYSTLGATGE